MTNTDIITEQHPPSRRRFVWAVGFASVFAAIAAATGLRFPRKRDILPCGPATTAGTKKMVKMLTQDGKLVEVDASLLNAAKKKITDTELQHWIKG
jgi:hypothetical protein